MCGRYTLHRPAAEVAAQFEALAPVEVAPRYNVAPTDPVVVVARVEGERRLLRARWGLVPFFMKDKKGPPLINARLETATTSGAFRGAWRHDQFCVIPADGFFEWRREGKNKLPFLFTRADGRLMGFAGLWDSYRGDDGERVLSCTVLTGRPNPLVATVHDRMPVILRDEDVAGWLGGDARRDPESWLARLGEPFPAEAITATAVSTRVNSVKNDDPGCLAPL